MSRIKITVYGPVLSISVQKRPFFLVNFGQKKRHRTKITVQGPVLPIFRQNVKTYRNRSDTLSIYNLKRLSHIFYHNSSQTDVRTLKIPFPIYFL